MWVVYIQKDIIVVKVVSYNMVYNIERKPKLKKTKG